MFNLLKKLKNSKYYYYSDTDEEEQSESVSKSVLSDDKTEELNAIQTMADLNARVEALKQQVELLKKNNNQETIQLKQQITALTNEKEKMDLRNEMNQKKMEYYQKMEVNNAVLEKKMASQSEHVTHLQEQLAKAVVPVSDNQTIAALENELATTKSQLIKYIKRDPAKSSLEADNIAKEKAEFMTKLSFFASQLKENKEVMEELFNETSKKLPKD